MSRPLESDDRYSDDYRRRRHSLAPNAENDLLLKHCRFGIGSFCLALIGGGIELTILVLVILAISDLVPFGIPGPRGTKGNLSALVGFLVGGTLCLLASALGIAVLCKGWRKKALAVLGVVGIAFLVILALLGLALAGKVEPVALMMDLGFFAGGFLCLVGLVLGIVGLCEGQRKKTIAILGMVMNVLAILGIGAAAVNLLLWRD
jgi:hypothetical protein